MSFVALAGAIGAGATALGATAGVASAVGAIGAGAIGGAGLGALGSAITGGDVGKGALFGALGGGITGGLGSAVGAMGGSAAGSAPGAATGAVTTPVASGSSSLGLEAAKQAINTPVALSNAAPALTSATQPVSSAWGMGQGSLIGSGTAPGIAPGTFGTPALGNSLGIGVQSAPAFSNASAFAAPQVNPLMAQMPQLNGVSEQALEKAAAHLATEPGKYAGTFFGQNPMMTIGAGSMLGNYLGNNSGPTQATPPGQEWNPLSYYKFNARKFQPTLPTYAPYQVRYANGGITALNPNPNMMQSGPAKVDFMGQDAYPTSQQKLSFYSSPSQMPTSAQQAAASYEPATNPLTGEPLAHFAGGGLLGGIPGARAIGDWAARNSVFGLDDATQIPVVGTTLYGQPTQYDSMGQPYAEGGITNLGHYSDGGNLTRGPGDGVSDDIPATIAGKQPARLADGEFVVPARAVSELGNGSTEAGAKRLYAMVDQIQNKRKKSMGKKNIAVDSKARTALPV